jgi:hypothetical protein
MTAINRSSLPALDGEHLDLALRSLAIRLEENHADAIELVVCGGSALILTGLVVRTTQDVDVVALMRQGTLCSPAPLPASLLISVREVAEDLALPPDWLNNHPSHDEGGLFQMGLPAGFADRLSHQTYGHLLIVHFIHRIDQIHFKLYASVDRGGYHITDLIALKPSPEEIESAARWSMTHDVSEGFLMVLKRLLRSIGYDIVAERL